jgi:GMP synthase (glutamine-hydrolysing)
LVSQLIAKALGARVYPAGSKELGWAQAFAYGAHTLALQFHVEAAGRALEAWFVGHTCEIAATPGASVRALREATLRNSPLLMERGSACLRAWLTAQSL